MPPQYFFIISKTGARPRRISLSRMAKKENILFSVGIKVEYEEPLYEGEYKGMFRTVGDKEHAEMMTLH